MRPSFTDYQRLKNEAKRTINKGSSYLRRWWSQKYNRPTNDPLFTNRPLAVWAREMFEDVYEERRSVLAQLEDEDIKSRERERLNGQLRRLNTALGEDPFEASSDPLVDKWLREIDAGITPDLDERQ